MRTQIVVGNWKMNNSISESIALAEAVAAGIADIPLNCEAGIAPAFPALGQVASAISRSPLQLAAQNCHFEDNGAYTGEVSTSMLKSAGCSWVILGHSERRQYFGEDNQVVNRKVKKALAAGLKVILCVGETLEERESGVTETIVNTQVREGLQGVDDVSRLVIAYEPVWAIGTGKTASKEQAEEVHASIRATLSELYGSQTAEGIRIQYGGSVKPSNASELFAMPNIDGGLIGGASLKPEDFIAILTACK
ncbi:MULTISPECIES: triose-phosphate isomerase [Prosthecochloris]|uniref:Triosephosphate isomerase n=1 Tax=Prosthecochloris vibrioformis TaxID=1098 RepID=A0A5C4S3C8_PROVB|nr:MULTISPECIES: triose-phosphate isomerase [Prosthecochloris]ANT64444.1 Triosephosphate isomerase [Prosthecochloris sp. CIB 2401]TNJ37291.1 triose-phosphate isomerase [Prosthecochloris vibrioformis]